MGQESFRKLEDRKFKILNLEVESWRLKSRVIWISHGDNNTKKLLKFSNQRRVTNAIWDLKDSCGNVVSSQRNLERAVVSYFSDLFKSNGSNNIMAQLKVFHNYPIFFSLEEGLKIGEPVSLKEIEEILKKIANSKSLGPDG